MEFPAAGEDWLISRFEAKDHRFQWSVDDPFLRGEEVIDLARWLRRIVKGKVGLGRSLAHREWWALEPNLSFRLDRPQEPVTLTAIVSQECLPPALLTSSGLAETYEITFRPSPEQLSRFADGLSRMADGLLGRKALT